MDLASLFGRNINGWQLGQGLTNAPSFDFRQGQNPLFNATMSNAGAGRLDNGIAAFMPKQWSQPMIQNQGIDGDGRQYGQDVASFNQSVGSLAGQLGRNPNQQWYNPNGERFSQRAGMPKTAYQSLNNELKDIWRVSGLSQGWDGRNNERGASSTLYQANGSQWSPISQSQQYTVPKNPGWIKGEGSDFIAGMSMMLPAVGGWAGLANTVAPSVTSGLASGIGNAATNTLLNTLGNSLMTGSFNPLSAVTGSLGSMFGGGNVPLGGGSNFNSLGQLMGSGTGAAIRNTAPMRGEMGQLFNTGRSLASLFGRLT